MDPDMPTSTSTGPSARTPLEAYQLYDAADDEDSFETFIEAAEAVLETNIHSYHRIKLLILLGTAVADELETAVFYYDARDRYRIAEVHWDRSLEGVPEALDELSERLEDLGQVVQEEMQGDDDEEEGEDEEEEEGEDEQEDIAVTETRHAVASLTIDGHVAAIEGDGVAKMDSIPKVPGASETTATKLLSRTATWEPEKPVNFRNKIYSTEVSAGFFPNDVIGVPTEDGKYVTRAGVCVATWKINSDDDVEVYDLEQIFLGTIEESKE